MYELNLCKASLCPAKVSVFFFHAAKVRRFCYIEMKQMLHFCYDVIRVRTNSPVAIVLSMADERAIDSGRTEADEDILDKWRSIQ